jgi:hypothetical protein
MVAFLREPLNQGVRKKLLYKAHRPKVPGTGEVSRDLSFVEAFTRRVPDKRE